MTISRIGDPGRAGSETRRRSSGPRLRQGRLPDHLARRAQHHPRRNAAVIRWPQPARHGLVAGLVADDPGKRTHLVGARAALDHAPGGAFVHRQQSMIVEEADEEPDEDLEPDVELEDKEVTKVSEEDLEESQENAQASDTQASVNIRRSTREVKPME